MKRLKSFLLNFSLALAALLVMLVLVELALQKYHFFGARISWSQPDTLLAWKYTPNAEYWFFKENDHPIIGKINRYGWRDRDWSLEKPPNTLRVAVLGDSFVEALQVEQERTFLALAETELNRLSAQRFELMNFGRSGFTTTEELLALERDIAPFAPDLVVVFFFAENDIEDVSREFSPRALGPYFDWSEDGKLSLDLSFNRSTDFKIRSAINGLKQRSALFSLLVERINLLMHGHGAPAASTPSVSVDSLTNGNVHLVAAEQAVPEPKRLGGAFSLATAHPDARFQKAFALNKRLLQEIQMKCRQMQAKFMLVCINMAAYYPERQAELRAQDPTFSPYFFDEALSEFAAQNGIPFIGLQKVFEEEHRRTGLLLQYGHWNYGGHRLVARVLADSIANIYLKQNTLTSAAATSE